MRGEPPPPGPGRAGRSRSRERGRGDQVVGRRAREIAEHALEQAGVLLAGANVLALEQRAGERGVRRHADEVEAWTSARASRRSAVARSAPCAMTLASIGSYAVPTSVPARMPESTRTPGSAGSR